MTAAARVVVPLSWLANVGLAASTLVHCVSLAQVSLPRSLWSALLCEAALVYLSATIIVTDWHELARRRWRARAGLRPYPRWFRPAAIAATVYAVPWFLVGQFQSLASVSASAIALNLYAVGMLRMWPPAEVVSGSSESEERK